MRALLSLLTLTLCCLLKNGYCVISFKDFIENKDAMDLVKEHYNTNSKRLFKTEKLLKKMKEKKIGMSRRTLQNYVKEMREAGGGTPNFQASASGNPGSSNPNDSRKAGGGTPNFQAPQIAQQSSNFTSGNPGSSTSASNKGKSTNFSKESNPDNWSLSSIPGSSSHYGDAMPSQQVPPMDDDTFVPSQTGTDSMNWLGENLQRNDEDLDSVVRPKNTSLFKRALGFMSSLGGASPQEPQFSPSIHDTAAASSYYPSNQPDDQTLESMVTPRNQKGFDGTPFLPNQSQSTGWPGASNFFSPTPNTSNFNSGNPGSSAIPFQQAPLPGTSLAFPNYPSNQSASLNSSTNFGPFQTETPSWDWSGENSHNNTGTLDSVVNKRKPSSSKDKNATKTEKKPRK